MNIKPMIGALLISAGIMSAQVPGIISYQGRVKVEDTDFSGLGRFKFALVSTGTNVSRQATATATVTSGFVTGITVTDGGGATVGRWGGGHRHTERRDRLYSYRAMCSPTRAFSCASGSAMERMTSPNSAPISVSAALAMR
jgi:hypothetical protein